MHSTRNPSNQVLDHRATPGFDLNLSLPIAKSVLAQHNARVTKISGQITHHHQYRRPFRLTHSSTNSTRPLSSKGPNLISTSDLSHILNIDTSSRTCLVEPNVSMDRLVEATLPHGLIPPVVMEFPGITVGGGFSGTSGESSSFRHGFFDQSVSRVEMVLGDGSVVWCSDDPADPRRDLFKGARSGSCGTLGVVTMLEVRLIPAKRYVQTSFWAVRNGVEEAMEKIKEATELDPARSGSESEVDFVDGIMFSQREGVVVTGRMVDDPSDTKITKNDAISISQHTSSSSRVQTFSRPQDPWFYLYAQSLLDSARSVNPVDPSTVSSPAPKPTVLLTTINIPLPDYLFRYDRGGFWVGRSAFDYFRPIPIPFRSWTRRLLDDFMHTRMLYSALHASGQSKHYIVQDLALPYDNVPEFVHYLSEAFDIWPLWLCPLKQAADTSFDDADGAKGRTFHPHDAQRFPTAATDNLIPLMNIGLWGQGPLSDSASIQLNRHLEHTLRELAGMKWGYAHHYYPRDEFWAMYDEEWYRALRTKYYAEDLPDVWEKVTVKVPGVNVGLEEDGEGEGDEKWTAAARTTSESQSWTQSFLESWPINGLYGVYAAIRSVAYREDRKKHLRPWGWAVLKWPNTEGQNFVRDDGGEEEDGGKKKE